MGKAEIGYSQVTSIVDYLATTDLKAVAVATSLEIDYQIALRRLAERGLLPNTYGELVLSRGNGLLSVKEGIQALGPKLMGGVTAEKIMEELYQQTAARVRRITGRKTCATLELRVIK